MQDIKQVLKGLVTQLLGPHATNVVDSLYQKKHVNEFLIAKRLKLTINQTRNVLYRLADEGLVSFTRKKDTKKGGWYTYFWTLDLGKALQKHYDLLCKQVDAIDKQITTQRVGRFYTCQYCSLDVSEEQALQQEYVCLECGEPLVARDTTSVVAQFEKDKAKLMTIVNHVKKQLDGVLVDNEKIRQRKIKAEVRKKAKERAVKRAIAAKLRAKLKKTVAKVKKVVRSTKKR